MSKSTGRIKWSEVTYLEKGGVFTHGSISELKRLKGQTSPAVLRAFEEISIFASVTAVLLKDLTPCSVLPQLEARGAQSVLVLRGVESLASFPCCILGW